MTTKEYIVKYSLNKGTNFNRNEFIRDLSVDFMTLLEIGKARENLKGFNNAITAIKHKFDAINNKTRGDISKMWNYFFATVIVKIREQLFPQQMQKIREEREERQRQREERNRWADYSFGYETFFHELLASLFRVQIPIVDFNFLGLTEKSTMEDVKTAYRSLSMQHHPDKGGNNEMFIKITEAKNRCLAYLAQ